MEYKQYTRKNISEMRPYEIGEDLKGIFINAEDLANGSPKEGDMIARNPNNHKDKWLVNQTYFRVNLEEIKSNLEEERTFEEATEFLEENDCISLQEREQFVTKQKPCQLRQMTVPDENSDSFKVITND